MDRVQEVLADWHGVSPSRIGFGASTCALLEAWADLCLKPGDRVLALGLCRAELRTLLSVRGVRLEVLPWSAPLPGLAAYAALYVCSPHDLTGTLLEGARLEMLLESGAPVLLEEKYAPYLHAPPVWPDHPRLIRLHLPLPAYGWPAPQQGERDMGAAYALLPPALAARWTPLEPPPGLDRLVRLPALEAQRRQGVAALEAQGLLLAEALGVPYQGVPYLLMEVDFAAVTAKRLEARGVRVGITRGHGLPRHLRIATRTGFENALLLEALAEVGLPVGHLD